jgi:hypothetical protein
MADVRPPHARSSVWLELIVAAAVILISVASLWVAVKAARTQEKLLAASVWPFLQFETSDFNDIDFTLRNAGVGPARLRWATLYYGTRPYGSARAALRACCGYTAKSRPVGITQFLQERVLTANQTVAFLTLRKTASDATIWNRLDRERLKFHMRACYCSVLDDCWIFDERRAQPQPVKVCPPAEQPVYSG